MWTKKAGIAGLLLVASLTGVPLSEALTCTRYSQAMASCDDGTWVVDSSSTMRSVTGPGAERGLSGYPIPFGGRADAPLVPSAPPTWYQPLPARSPGGACITLSGRTVCW